MLPDPVRDPLNEIHVIPDDADQAHVERVVTRMLPEPPAGETATVSGVTV